MSSSSMRLTVAVVVLAVIGAAITGYLTMQHGRGESPACIVGHGCTVIATSKYAHIGTLPTASLGMLAYLMVLLLSAARLVGPPFEVERVLRFATLGIAFTGTAFSAWLMYLALAVLHAECIWCISSAVTITLIFLLMAAETWRARAGEG